MNYPSNAGQEQRTDDTHGLYLIRDGEEPLLVDTFQSCGDAIDEAHRRIEEWLDGSGAYRIERLESTNE